MKDRLEDIRAEINHLVDEVFTKGDAKRLMELIESYGKSSTKTLQEDL